VSVSCATSQSSYLPSSSSASTWRVLANAARILWDFGRPHTLYGTAISIVSVSFMALPWPLGLTSQALAAIAVAFVQAIVPALLANISIVGWNQVSDVEIDRINKPFLPLPSERMSVERGTLVVVVCGLAATVLAALSQSLPLFITVTASIALGVAYSTDLPFLRWKRSPVLAAGCILTVRAVLVQFGFFWHMNNSLMQQGLPTALTQMISSPALPLSFQMADVILPSSLVLASSVMCLMSIVIALGKDIPDVEGDKRGGIRSLSVQLGQGRVLGFCVALMCLVYAGAIAFGTLCTSNMFSMAVTTVGHASLCAIMLKQAQKVDVNEKSTITAFYMFVWKLFYAEYLLLPFAR